MEGAASVALWQVKGKGRGTGGGFLRLGWLRQGGVGVGGCWGAVCVRVCVCGGGRCVCVGGSVVWDGCSRCVGALLFALWL